jgi:hypothetical protein
MSEQPTPQTIAEEYLREEKPSHYKANALTLLRVLGGAENVRRIVQEAVGNPDRTLRQRAVSELAELEAPDKSVAVGVLHEIMEKNGTNPPGLRAYIALGAIHETKAARPDFLRRVRLECRLHEEVHANKNARFHVRTVAATAITTAVAAALALLYLSALGLLRALHPSVPAAVILVSVVCALLAAPILTLRSIGFGSHIDRFAGVMAECWWPVPYSLVICAISYLGISLMVTDPQISNKMASFPTIVFTLIATIATVLGVRAGTIVARGGAKSPKLDLIWTILSAGSLGALVFTGLLLLKPDNVLCLYYATFIPAIFGIAGAFSAVDAFGAKTEPRLVLQRRVLGALTIVAFAALLLVPLRGRSGEFRRIQAGQEVSVAVNRLPQVLSFSLNEKTKVFVGVQAKNKNPTDPRSVFVDWTLKNSSQEDLFSNKEYSSRGTTQFERSIYRPERLFFSKDLEAGDYWIHLADTRQAGFQHVIFPWLFASVIQRDALPPISATVFGSKREEQPSGAKKEIFPDDSVPVTLVPFVRSVQLTDAQPFLNLSVGDNAGFWPSFYSRIYSDTGKDVTSKSTSSVGPRLEPGTYLVVVDQVGQRSRDEFDQKPFCKPRRSHPV